ncbi:MAG TPA: hypothetical protein VFV99_15660 [Kofleriaceae bacterium]|nr:hypothetical protein [Kofleriaceae bacterium]
MKRLIAFVSLSAALATTGCAHKQLTNEQVAKYAVTGASAVGLVVLFIASGVAKQNAGPTSANLGAQP